MNLPELELFLFSWELASMSEYSTTIPSGTTIGTLWKCNVNYKPQPGWSLVPDHSNPRWVVRMYSEHEDPNRVSIIQFTVIMRHGPPPHVYRAPDWSFFEGWKKEARA